MGRKSFYSRFSKPGKFSQSNPLRPGFLLKKLMSESVQVPQQARPFVSALRQSTQMG